MHQCGKQISHTNYHMIWLTSKSQTYSANILAKNRHLKLIFCKTIGPQANNILVWYHQYAASGNRHSLTLTASDIQPQGRGRGSTRRSNSKHGSAWKGQCNVKVILHESLFVYNSVHVHVMLSKRASDPFTWRSGDPAPKGSRVTGNPFVWESHF